VHCVCGAEGSQRLEEHLDVPDPEAVHFEGLADLWPTKLLLQLLQGDVAVGVGIEALDEVPKMLPV